MAIADTFKEIRKDKTIHVIIIILVIVVVVSVIYKVYQAVQTANNAIGDILGQKQIEAQTGISPARQDVCKQVALDVRGACTFLWFTTHLLLCNDEEIIAALNRLNSKEETALACVFFRQNVGIGIKSIVDNSQFLAPVARITYYSSLT